MNVIDTSWRKSSYSNQTGGDCVEVADTTGHGVAVRDTQNRSQGHLSVSGTEWTAFLKAVRADSLGH